MNSAAINTGLQVSFQISVFELSRYLGVELLSHMVDSFLVLRAILHFLKLVSYS